MISFALQKELFSKSVRKKVLIPEKLICTIEKGLVDRTISSLGLARRAGRIIAGYAKVENALRQGKVLMRIEAKDGAVDGREKLNRIRPKVTILDSLSSKELAKAFDRGHIVHLAVSVNNHSDKGLEERLIRDFGRLERFRKTNPDTRLENVAYGCIETIV
jgi:ribosomal protein L7Ae-like RNA K-turn-binding protein